MISLPDLADKLNQHGLMNKSFFQMSKTEIGLLISAVISSPDGTTPIDGWVAPCIDNGELVLTFDSHPKYHWWTAEGQSIYDTLIEINAPWEVARKYMDSKTMTEDAYTNKLPPF